MGTTFRPSKKMDENFFSQLVFLSRQTRKTRKFEVRALAATGGRDPDFTYKQPSENKGGVAETFIRNCENCLEDFCVGACRLFDYEDHQRKAPRENNEARLTEQSKKRKNSKKKNK